MEKRVVCIGQALVDCITRGKEPWRKRVYRAQSISLNTGGDALNEASLLAKMGIPVSLVCGLGEDVAGNLVYQTALERGIDVSHVSRLSKLATPIANLTVHLSSRSRACSARRWIRKRPSSIWPGKRKKQARSSVPTQRSRPSDSLRRRTFRRSFH